ncbi:hypothetical protein FH972_002382 [Carpinus fangiana]|uniref:Uncharacterized protein n=1 Tax=Carpinus fangiana TaxID=176857 RepID=A0A5N6QEP2_9ROSI|nr:hypothetical protein FH972_002382 [Carpinus fangiana]
MLSDDDLLATYEINKVLLPSSERAPVIFVSRSSSESVESNSGVARRPTRTSFSGVGRRYHQQVVIRKRAGDLRPYPNPSKTHLSKTHLAFGVVSSAWWSPEALLAKGRRLRSDGRGHRRKLKVLGWGRESSGTIGRRSRWAWHRRNPKAWGWGREREEEEEAFFVLMRAEEAETVVGGRCFVRS